MNPLESYIQIVENAITKLGIDVAPTRGQKPGQWNLQKGTAKIALDIFQPQANAPVCFGATAVIMQMPESNKEKFLGTLLNLNHTMINAAFTIFNGYVFLRSSRLIQGMDENECLNIITTIGGLADHYDEVLQKDFPHRKPIGFRPGSSES